MSLDENLLWRCSACDTDGDCGNSTENRSLSLDFPSISIISPSSSENSKTFDLETNITAQGNLSYCYYNVTVGASIEVANTEISNCNKSVNITVSSYADYVLNVFANTTTGLISTQNLSFSVELLSSPEEFLAGGGTLAELEEMLDWWRIFKNGGSFSEVAEAYNPWVYPVLGETFYGLFDSEKLDEFLPTLLWDIPVLIIKYLSRQPASLVAYGGASNV